MKSNLISQRDSYKSELESCEAELKSCESRISSYKEKIKTKCSQTTQSQPVSTIPSWISGLKIPQGEVCSDYYTPTESQVSEFFKHYPDYHEEFPYIRNMRKCRNGPLRFYVVYSQKQKADISSSLVFLPYWNETSIGKYLKKSISNFMGFSYVSPDKIPSTILDQFEKTVKDKYPNKYPKLLDK